MAVGKVGQEFLEAWDAASVDAECKSAYGRYSRALDAHYEAYYKARPGERGRHPRQARDIACALPPSMDDLAEEIPPALRHAHHLSGRSSQMLGLGVFGAAARLDPSSGWFTERLGLTPRPNRVTHRFEVELPVNALGESPRVTSVDYLAESDGFVVAVEIKRGEEGLGRCSCRSRRDGRCSARVVAREAYWSAAKSVFGLPGMSVGGPCPISLGYQAVRNVAAVKWWAGEREAVFALVYDVDNPYFKPTGAWPGWPEILRASASRARTGTVRPISISWQEIVGLLPDSLELTRWLSEKHRLPTGGTR